MLSDAPRIIVVMPSGLEELPHAHQVDVQERKPEVAG
jgi:hypothetical protein